MRRILVALALATILLAAFGGAVFADDCTDLVDYGISKLGSVEDEDLQIQIRTLLEQARSQCLAGNTEQGFETARQAIDMIK